MRGFLLLGLGLTSPALSATLTVGPSGTYATIADALDNAQDGDVLSLEAGTCQEELPTITVDVSFVGTGQQNTLIEPTNEQVTFDAAVSFTDITIDGTSTNARGLIVNERLDLNTTEVLGFPRGAIRVEDAATLAVNESNFVGNGGLGLNLGGGDILMRENSTATIVDSFFEGSVADYGGAIYADGAVLEIQGGRFTSGEAYFGGAINAQESEVTLTGTEFTQNQAIRDFGFGGDGGALALDEGNITLNSTVFTANVSEQTGGAVQIAAGVLDVTGGELRENRSDYGGALYMNGAEVTLSSVLFINNEASNSGGAIRMFAQSGGGGGPGGASGVLQVESTEFSRNSSGNYGGAIGAFQGRAILVNETQFLSNEADRGGAISASDIRSVVVGRALVCGNESVQDGGGIRVSTNGADGISFGNVVFQENVSGTEGGALYLNEVEAAVVNNTFVGNEANDGGGLFTDESELLFVNNLVAFTPEGSGWEGSNSQVASSYNGWWQNTINDVAGDADIGTNAVLVDPQLSNYTPNGDCLDDQLWPAAGSPLIDAGEPSLSDPDGSVSDIGAYGGENADWSQFVDEDGDGFAGLYDCDDTDNTVYPGAAEACDGIDNDCDGDIDEGLTLNEYYVDSDGDGVGGDDTVEACEPPEGTSEITGDCDDTNPEVNPNEAEQCDEIDNDCDGEIDEDIPDAFYEDADGDGFGGPNSVDDCDPPDGYTAQDGDCDDSDETIFPGAEDIDGDGVDSDCDGTDGPSASGDPDDIVLTGAGCACSSSSSPVPVAIFSLFPLLALARRRR